MKQEPDPAICRDLYRRAEDLTDHLRRDQEKLRDINSSIHANELQQERLRHEIEEIRREIPFPILPGPEDFNPAKRPGRLIGRVGGPIGVGVQILDGEFDKDRRIRELRSEISSLSFDKNDLLVEQTRQTNLINDTIADRAALRRQRFEIGCPGSRTSYF